MSGAATSPAQNGTARWAVTRGPLLGVGLIDALHDPQLRPPMLNPGRAEREDAIIRRNAGEAQRTGVARGLRCQRDVVAVRESRGRGGVGGAQIPGVQARDRGVLVVPGDVGCGPLSGEDASRSWNLYRSGLMHSSRFASTSSSTASVALALSRSNSAAAAGTESVGPCHKPSRQNATAGSIARSLRGLRRLARLTSKLARTARSPAVSSSSRRRSSRSRSCGCRRLLHPHWSGLQTNYRHTQRLVGAP
jgi:hypothetical protein